MKYSIGDQLQISIGSTVVATWQVIDISGSYYALTNGHVLSHCDDDMLSAIGAVKVGA